MWFKKTLNFYPAYCPFDCYCALENNEVPSYVLEAIATKHRSEYEDFELKVVGIVLVCGKFLLHYKVFDYDTEEYITATYELKEII